ncbi:MAG: CoA transferase, partial [Comamonas sp.]
QVPSATRSRLGRGQYLTPSEHNPVGLLEEALLVFDGVSLADELMAIGVPAAPVLNVAQALEHPHTQHREMIVEMGDYKGLGAPIKLSRTPASYRFAPLSEGREFLPDPDVDLDKTEKPAA